MSSPNDTQIHVKLQLTLVNHNLKALSKRLQNHGQDTTSKELEGSSDGLWLSSFPKSGRKDWVCYEIVSLRNVRSYTDKISPTWLSKHELNEDNTNRHADRDWGKLRRSHLYTKSYRQLRRAERGRKTGWLIIHYQMFRTQNINMQDITLARWWFGGIHP